MNFKSSLAVVKAYRAMVERGELTAAEAWERLSAAPLEMPRGKIRTLSTTEPRPLLFMTPQPRDLDAPEPVIVRSAEEYARLKGGKPEDYAEMFAPVKVLMVDEVDDWPTNENGPIDDIRELMNQPEPEMPTCARCGGAVGYPVVRDNRVVHWKCPGER